MQDSCTTMTACSAKTKQGLNRPLVAILTSRNCLVGLTGWLLHHPTTQQTTPAGQPRPVLSASGVGLLLKVPLATHPGHLVVLCTPLRPSRSIIGLDFGLYISFVACPVFLWPCSWSSFPSLHPFLPTLSSSNLGILLFTESFGSINTFVCFYILFLSVRM